MELEYWTQHRLDADLLVEPTARGAFDEFETSEDDLRKLADCSFVKRAITRCPTEDKDTVLRWLDRYAEIGQQIGAI